MKKTKISAALIIALLFAFAAYAEEAAESPAGVQASGGETVVGEASEPPKIQITVSQEIIDQQMKAYRGDLKEIVSEAELNLKKMKGGLKYEADEKTAAEKFSSGNDLAAAGKYIEAKADYRAALAAANTPGMKRKIKDKEKAIEPKVKEALKAEAQAASPQASLKN